MVTVCFGGGSPYGAVGIASKGGPCQTDKKELDIAAFQGEQVAQLAKKVFG
ncbi:hypothetical protein ACKLNO_06570 [Neisseriaceae bacterium B1]